MATALYAIDQVCRHTGLTSRTLRRWEDLGLLVPSHVDDRGYRHYSPADFDVIAHLVLLRTLGLPTPQRATWARTPAPAGLLLQMAARVESQVRLSTDLIQALRMASNDALDAIHLIQLLLRWRQP